MYNRLVQRDECNLHELRDDDLALQHRQDHRVMSAKT